MPEDQSPENPIPEPPPELKWGLIIDVFNVLEEHGIKRGDNRHVGAAVGVVGQLVKVYSGQAEWT